jgi:hypothetical protein
VVPVKRSNVAYIARAEFKLLKSTFSCFLLTADCNGMSFGFDLPRGRSKVNTSAIYFRIIRPAFVHLPVSKISRNMKTNIKFSSLGVRPLHAGKIVANYLYWLLKIVT